jgi:SAM-dependent methyltransferase
MARVQDRHWWFAARRQILGEQLHALRLPADAEILEVGSGTGANLALLAEFGRVTGLEMSAEAIASARGRGLEQPGRVTLHQGRCPEDLASLQQRFDLVCLFDVLEHIENDQGALSALRACLKPGGRILISVPAYQWLWSAHDESLHHRRRYRLGELARLCADCGLVVTTSSYFNTMLFPLAVIGRVMDRLLGRRQSSGSAVPAAAVNAGLRRVFAFERHLLGRVPLPFGLSILVVAHDKASAK